MNIIGSFEALSNNVLAIQVSRRIFWLCIRVKFLKVTVSDGIIIKCYESLI